MAIDSVPLRELTLSELELVAGGKEWNVNILGIIFFGVTTDEDGNEFGYFCVKAGDTAVCVL
jgi:hypothetical protein